MNDRSISLDTDVGNNPSEAKPDSANPTPPRTLTERVLSATVAIAIAHAFAKIFGLVQARVIGHYYGFDTENDAFVLAYEGVIWSLFLIGEESLGPAFLPVFMSARQNDSEEKAWRFTSTLFNLQCLLLFAVVALLMLFPAEAIAWLTRMDAPGALNAEQAARSELAVRFLASMAPALLGLSVGSLTYMIMNGYKKFFWPAFADAALKAALVAGVVIGHQAGLGADALIAGVLAAGLAKILVHLFALGGKLKFYRPLIDLNDAHFRRFLILVAPLLVGIVFAKMRDYYNNYYIISSLEQGMLSVNSYGRKIYTALGWLVPYPLSIALFPFFCELVARDDRQALGDFMTRASRMLLLIFLPLTAVIVVLSVPLAQALFQTGKVSAADAALAGRVNACYSMVLPFFALEYIYMQAYFSTHRTISVTVIGMIFSTLSMTISYVGVIALGLTGPDAVVLVASGYTFSRALKTLTLAGVLKAKGLPLLPASQMIPFLAKAVIITLACGAAAYGSLRIVERVQPAPAAPTAPADAEISKSKKSGSGMKAVLRAAPQLAIPGLAAVVVFFFGCKAMRMSELDEMIAFTRQKLRRKRPAPV